VGVSTDPATGPSKLDSAALRDLFDLLGDDRDALEEIADAFLEEAPLRLAELRDGLSSGDLALVARAAHTLKANAATFGARELESRSRVLEEAARAGSPAATLVDDVESAWRETHASLLHLRDAGPTS
jgi:HPt (histidine-containing phosphotransfer) domain-containing protein